MRYSVEMQYDGTNYHGWQYQPNAISVQEVVSNELAKLLPSKKVSIVGCGRTDTGVHASQYFFHFDTEEELDTESCLFKLNHMLPLDMSIKHIRKVPEDWHARFSARKRTYHYYINFDKDPFDRFHSCFFTKELDIEAMNRACTDLMNYKDFTSFSRVSDSKTNDCDIFTAYWELMDSKAVFTITANRFLRNMVRAIVGTMLDVGTHKMSLAEFNEVIKAKDRSRAGKSAPGHGLFLAKIEY